MTHARSAANPGRRFASCSKAGRHRHGFALVLVLWVLAGLTVVAVAVANSARIGGQSTRLLRDRVRAEAAFIGTAARIQVIAATSPAFADRFSGLRGTLFADGRPTEVDADEDVVVQDMRGLINLNHADPPTLARLLQQCGAASGAATTAVATLTDYIDPDDLKLVNGAEAFDYRADGTLPPPRNAELLSRDEVWRIKGWPELRSGWDAHHCADAVTVHGDARFNQATATLPVLRARGIDESIARGLVDARLEGITYDPGRSGDGGPVSLLQLGAGTVGPALRVRHSARFVEWQLEYELELTPTRSGGPWRLHEVRYGSRPAGPPMSKVHPTFPAVDHRPSEQESMQGNAPSRLPFGN